MRIGCNGAVGKEAEKETIIDHIGMFYYIITASDDVNP
jgi:hypothetical protein